MEERRNFSVAIATRVGKNLYHQVRTAYRHFPVLNAQLQILLWSPVRGHDSGVGSQHDSVLQWRIAKEE